MSQGHTGICKKVAEDDHVMKQLKIAVIEE